ncbi:MAG: hypothetical protein J0M07_25260 [Anaerolineae bacterium]|nr:hypothetical protein [Anaerolineae bacterium]
MAHTYELQEVFGEWQTANAPTYVDRDGLDAKLAYLLKSSNLIVLHGESRQGKTILQRKHLQEAQIIKINCSVGMSALNIKTEILRRMHARIIMQVDETNGRDTTGEGGFDGGIDIPGIGKLGGKATVTHGVSHEAMTSSQVIGDPNNINFLVEQWQRDKRRIVIDDFHYLSDQEQSQLAFDFKGLTENGVQLLVIGVWANANRLTTFNNQLRTKELSIKWTDAELMQVLELGEQALNIAISKNIKNSLVRDASGSVGLLQIITEALCQEENIFGYQRERRTISNVFYLDAARKRTCAEKYNSRFSEALRTIADGKNLSEGRMYEKILRAVVTMTDAELLNGVRPGKITKMIEALGLTEGKGNQGHVTQTLEKLNGLQEERRISPPIFYYDKSASQLRLVDRTFLFFRRNKTVSYPWENSDE